MTTPSDPSAKTGVPIDSATGLPDAKFLAALTAAYESSRKSLEDFSTIMQTKGIQAAIEYANALAKAHERAMEMADSVSGFSEALEDNSRHAAANYQTIQRQLKESTERIQALKTELIDLKKLQDKMTFAPKSAEEKKAFSDIATEIGNAESALQKFYDKFDDQPELEEDKFFIMEQMRKTREELKKAAISSPEDFAAASTVEKEKFVKQMLGRGVDATTAKQYADTIFGALTKQIKAYHAAINSGSPEQQAYAENLLKEIELNEKLTLAIKDQSEAIEASPLAKFNAITKKGLEDANKEMTSAIDRLTGATGKAGFFASSMLAAAGPGGVGALTKSLSEGLVNALLTPEKAAMRLVSVFDNLLIKSTFKFDETLAGVNRSTGGFRQEFEKISKDSSSVFSGTTLSNLSVYGVTLDKFGKTYGDLARNIGGFNKMSDDQRRLMTENAAVLENLGLSASEYGSSIRYFMGSIGMSAEGASKAVLKLTDDALAAGKSVGDYIKEFDGLKSKLSGFSRDAQEIFRELNAISQATKGQLSASDITNLADGFKDFDSAVESTRKLNAALGGLSLNPINVVGKDASEVALEVKRAFDMSGKQFDDFNYGYKRMLAELFGGDMAKASAFFKMKNSEILNQMGNQTDAEKLRAKKLEESTAAMDKLKTSIENVKLSMTPLVKFFTGIADVLTKVTNVIKPQGVFTVAVLGATALLKKAFAALSVGTENMLMRVFARVRKELGIVRKEIEQTAMEANNINPAGAAGGGKLKGFLGKAGKFGMYALGASLLINSYRDTPEAETEVTENSNFSEEEGIKTNGETTRSSHGYLETSQLGYPIPDAPNIFGRYFSKNMSKENSDQNTTGVQTPRMLQGAQKDVVVGGDRFRLKQNDKVLAYDPDTDEVPGMKIFKSISSEISSFASNIKSFFSETSQDIKSNASQAVSFTNKFSDNANNFSSINNKETNMVSSSEEYNKKISAEIAREGSTSKSMSLIKDSIKMQTDTNKQFFSEAVEKLANLTVSAGPTFLHPSAAEEWKRNTASYAKDLTVNSLTLKTNAT